MTSRIVTALLNRLLFYKKGIIYAKGLRVYGVIRFAGCKKPNVKIGKNVHISSSWKANPAGGGQTHTLLYIGNEGTLKIGNNVGISNSTIVAHDEIVIEDDVNIGVNCVIYDTDFHSVDYKKRMKASLEGVKKAPVIIGKGAWIGGHCIVLKGCTIGARSVIGAGSVVTHDIPADEIWAGNPALFIRKIAQ